MGDTPSADKPLNDRLLRSWTRCRRRAWLDRHGDPALRVYTAHRTLQLDDQQRSFVALLPRKPGHGIEACARGDAGVVGLRLTGLTVDGRRLEAHPVLLQRQSGQSRWGDYSYRPVLARQGRRLTREHRLQLALSARLLSDLQQAPVTHGLALAGAGRRLEKETVALGDSLQRQLDEALRKLAADLERPTPPPLAADRRKCTLCSWRGVCNAEARREGHLSEVSGIGAKRRDMLLELGIHSLNALADADPVELEEQLKHFGEQHGAVAAPLVAQARAQRDGQVESLLPSSALPELVDAPGVLLYDIESDPDARDDFLHGFVRLPRDLNGGWALDRATYHLAGAAGDMVKPVAGSVSVLPGSLSRLAGAPLRGDGISGTAQDGAAAGCARGGSTGVAASSRGRARPTAPPLADASQQLWLENRGGLAGVPLEPDRCGRRSGSALVEAVARDRSSRSWTSSSPALDLHLQPG